MALDHSGRPPAIPEGSLDQWKLAGEVAGKRGRHALTPSLHSEFHDASWQAALCSPMARGKLRAKRFG